MSLMEHGALRGLPVPDYCGGSIVNLLASIIHAFGGKSPHPGLKNLTPRTFEGVRKVVYLVVDGVGFNQLARFVNSGRGRHFFARQPCQRITTVFPTTTAAAVTSFSTGGTPAEHGVLGWHVHLHDLGLVSAILPGITRTGTAMVPSDFNLKRYLKLTSYLSPLRCHKRLLSFGNLAESRYSRAGTLWNRRGAFTTLQGMERQVSRFAKEPGQGLAYVYWPKYDTLCHKEGCHARKTMRHLEEIDLSLARLVRLLDGTRTLLFVTADHGIVEVPPKKRIDLSKVPGLLSCLAVLPSGDAREVSCFVRPRHVERFTELVQKHLSRACVCVKGEDILGSGLLGPGQPHPSLESRVGDFVLLARDDYAFVASLPHAAANFHKGNHGGLSRDEVFVPLYAITC